MYLVSGIQGTARVVNYAGLVRGKTQRLVKMEIAGQPQDGMLSDVESFIHGLRYGDDQLDIVRLDGVRRHMADYNQNHPDMPISYAVGAALAREEGPCTMRELFNAADKNMYINKNHVKREEAAAERRMNYQLLRRVRELATPSPTACTATLGRTPIGSFGAASPSSWPPTAATPGRWSRSWPSRWPQRTAAGYGNSSSPALWAVSWGRTPPPFRCSISPAAAARQPTAV